jgi:hypothetical protein
VREVHRVQKLLVAVEFSSRGVRIYAVAVDAPEGLQTVSEADRRQLCLDPKRRAVLGCGTVASYKRGCKCQECRAANAAYWRATHPPKCSMNQQLTQRAGT